MSAITSPPAAAASGPGAAFAPITIFADADRVAGPGARLRAVRRAAQDFRRWFTATGMPTYVGTFDLVTLPYPTRFGLWRAARSPAPFLWITNRLLVVRWQDRGHTRTLLFGPSDVELGANTPYFAGLAERIPGRLEPRVVRRHATVLEHLRRVGIAPEEVDYLVFDHLHTQDVRRWLGTTGPQADISPARPVDAVFANATLLVQAAELDALTDLHPLQRPWYQPATFNDIRRDAVRELHGDTLVGPGLALLSTPGHTTGNQTLCLNTSTGVWASSENVIAAELLTPEHSRIPGVRSWALEMDQEVVLNANTLEGTADQYNSCVKEKCIVDRSVRDARFLQFLPSSELTSWRLSPGTRPTFSHGGIAHGALR